MFLEVKDLTVYYGAVKAIEKVSFQVSEGEIVAMIGPNGAGKSTALKAVCSMLDAYGGAILEGSLKYDGTNIIGQRTDQLVRRGIGIVPEGRRVFPTMTIMENLELGAFAYSGQNGVKAQYEMVFELFPLLKERRRQKAGTLSTGEQQMLAIARALIAKPKLLLADEPSLGLSPNYVDLIFDKLLEINRMGTTILLVEQNARMALAISQRAYVFSIGKIETEGISSELMTDSRIKKVFLGG